MRCFALMVLSLGIFSSSKSMAIDMPLLGASYDTINIIPNASSEAKGTTFGPYISIKLPLATFNTTDNYLDWIDFEISGTFSTTIINPFLSTEFSFPVTWSVNLSEGDYNIINGVPGGSNLLDVYDTYHITLPALGDTINIENQVFSTDFLIISPSISADVSNFESETLLLSIDAPGFDGLPSTTYDTTFNYSVTETFDYYPVPEPTSIALFGASLVGIAAVRRRATR